MDKALESSHIMFVHSKHPLQKIREALTDSKKVDMNAPSEDLLGVFAHMQIKTHYGSAISVHPAIRMLNSFQSLNRPELNSKGWFPMTKGPVSFNLISCAAYQYN